MLLILRLYLVANLLIFWGFTVGFFFMPVRLGEMLGITLHSTTALADFRAMYGGMCLGVGVVFLLGLLKEGWRAPAVLLAVTTAAGLLLGRTLTIVVDGPASLYIYASMAGEVGATALGIWLLKRPNLAPAPQG